MIWFQVPSTLVSKLFIKLWFFGRKCIIPHTVLWIISSLNPSLSPILMNRKLTFNHKPLIIIYLVTFDFLILLVTKLYMVNGIFFGCLIMLLSIVPQVLLHFLQVTRSSQTNKKKCNILSLMYVLFYYYFRKETRRSITSSVICYHQYNQELCNRYCKIIMNFVVWAKYNCDLRHVNMCFHKEWIFDNLNLKLWTMFKC